MSENIENNKTFVQNAAFYIVGNQTIQNELMAFFITRKTGNPCSIVDEINYIHSTEKQEKVVLWDFQKSSPEKMSNELKIYNSHKKYPNHIVLFNVPILHNIQKEFILQGINGLFYEQDSLDIFLKGLQSILSGNLWFSREIMARYIFDEPEKSKKKGNMHTHLTARQIEILSLLAVGESNNDIAERLFISTNTVKNHLYKIYKKINVSNRIQASLWAAVNL